LRQFRTFRGATSAFVAWCSGERDPAVAYLDARQLVVGAAELTSGGWSLWPDGTMFTPSGWEYRGPIERAVLHRLSHTLQQFLAEPSASCNGPDGLCEIALGEPPIRWADRYLAIAGGDSMVASAFEMYDSHAVQLSADEGRLRRAVYIDEEFVLEAGMAFDRSIRVWPCRALPADAIFAPPPEQAATAIGRVQSALAVTSGSNRLPVT